MDSGVLLADVLVVGESCVDGLQTNFASLSASPYRPRVDIEGIAD